MKQLYTIIVIALISSSCGLLKTTETQKPQDQASTEFKVTEDLVDKPEVATTTEVEVAKSPSAELKTEQLAVQPSTETKTEEASIQPPVELKAEQASIQPPKEEMRAPVEPRHEDFENKKVEVAIQEVKKPEVYAQDSSKYEVKKNETLMMIAFKIYGDYSKWKELSALNQKELKHGIHPGIKLNYKAPEQEFSWQPSGLPYLIKTGNTLGTISSEKYGTPKKWKNIYENNKPLIKNPNLIFAGFTIYYIPTRDIASQSK
jgi:nucleoid-associated protein YgaU